MPVSGESFETPQRSIFPDRTSAPATTAGQTILVRLSDSPWAFIRVSSNLAAYASPSLYRCIALPVRLNQNDR